MLLIHVKKRGTVELWLVLVQRNEIVMYGLILIALLLINETNVIFDGTGPLLHLGGAL